MTITSRRHVASIRYAITVHLDEGEPNPSVGDVFLLGDMAVVRVVALRDEWDPGPSTNDPRECSLTVETLETIGRLANVS